MTSSTANTNYRTRISYQAGLLGGVCCIVSILLIVGNINTGPIIEEKITQDKLVMMQDVMPAANYDNNPLQESKTFAQSPFFAQPVTVMAAKKNNQLTGTVLQLSVQGWGGKIQLIMGINSAGEIIGVRVVNHKETPGLADKIEIKKSNWILNFNGASLLNTAQKNWAVKKDGGEYDQFAGATITPRAVVKGVHQGLLFHQHWMTEKKPQEIQDINEGNH